MKGIRLLHISIPKESSLGSPYKIFKSHQCVEISLTVPENHYIICHHSVARVMYSVWLEVSTLLLCRDNQGLLLKKLGP